MKKYKVCEACGGSHFDTIVKTKKGDRVCILCGAKQTKNKK